MCAFLRTADSWLGAGLQWANELGRETHLRQALEGVRRAGHAPS